MAVYEHIIAQQLAFDPNPVVKEGLQDGEEVILVSRGKPEVVATGSVVVSLAGIRTTTWVTTPEGGRVMVNKNRIEVKLSSISAEGASLQYIDKTGQANKKKLQDVGVGLSVLWDVSCLRRPAPAPVVPVPLVETEDPELISSDDDLEIDRLVQGAIDEGQSIMYAASEDVDLDTDDELLPGGTRGSSSHDLRGGRDEGEGPECDGCHGPHIKLDLLHALKRITSTLSTTHGALPFATARLRDAFSSPDQEDVAAVKKVVMRDHGLDEAGWIRYLRTNWRSVLKHCKRACPPPAVLVDRMDKFEQLYPDLQDATTGKPLFKPETWKRW